MWVLWHQGVLKSPQNFVVFYLPHDFSVNSMFLILIYTVWSYTQRCSPLLQSLLTLPFTAFLACFTTLMPDLQALPWSEPFALTKHWCAYDVHTFLFLVGCFMCPWATPHQPQLAQLMGAVIQSIWKALHSGRLVWSYNFVCSFWIFISVAKQEGRHWFLMGCVKRYLAFWFGHCGMIDTLWHDLVVCKVVVGF